HGLIERPRLEVPEMETVAVAAGFDVGKVEARLVGLRLAELGRDERVLARLVPEVVVERRRLAAVLPAAFQLERLRVEHREAARAVSLRVSEHRDDDIVPWHAMDGVGSRVAGRGDDLLRLDHLLDAWPAWVLGDVHDVDP